MTNEENKPESGPIGVAAPPPTPKRTGLWMTTAALVLAVIVAGCIIGSHETAAAVGTGIATPTVAVARVERMDLYNEVTVPAEFRPFLEVELNAKVTGYVDKMIVDFGDKVKAGQLLATLEVPELHDELDAANAAQGRALADYDNARLIYTRLVGVNSEHSNLVAQQDIDTAKAHEDAAAAAVDSAKADVEKYQTLVGYTQITAPFDGVVTGRFADPGALIQAGTSSSPQSRALLRVSDNYRLRLDFPVSVDDVKDIKVGEPVDVVVESLGGRKFTGNISRASLRVNYDTRTMETEIEVANSDLELVPGMYASISFKTENRPQALAIPIQAIPPGQSSTVYVINEKSEIEDRPIKLGINTPSDYEVLSGLKEGESVLVGSRSVVKPGEKVETKSITSQTPP